MSRSAEASGVKWRTKATSSDGCAKERIAPRERDPLRPGRQLHDVTRQQRAGAVRRPGPMQYRPAREDQDHARTTANVSPSQRWMDGDGRITPRRSAAWRWTGAPKAADQSYTVV